LYLFKSIHFISYFLSFPLQKDGYITKDGLLHFIEGFIERCQLKRACVSWMVIHPLVTLEDGLLLKLSSFQIRKMLPPEKPLLGKEGTGSGP